MSRIFCIDRGAIGSERHFLCGDKSYKWSDDIPPDTWVLRHRSVENDRWCLKTALRLGGVELSPVISESHVNSYRSILKSDYSFEKVKWQHVLPPNVYKSRLLTLTQEVTSALDVVDTTYHQKVFSRANLVFESMVQAAIDREKLDCYLSQAQHDSVRGCLQSFEPPEGDRYAPLVTYDRFASRTGRLTVSNGPQILTLKRDLRDVIRSSYDGGRVYYVDFSSLETRIALSLTGKLADSLDVYSDISAEFFGGKYERRLVKLVTLATLYGSSQESVRRLLGLSGDETREFFDSIERLFEIDKLKRKLKVEWEESRGKIRNFYGRVIPVPEEKLLVNSYVQSTGVDVALLGFSNIVECIKKNGYDIRPIFLLHDAILLDVHPRHFRYLEAIISVGQSVMGFDSKFRLHIE